MSAPESCLSFFSFLRMARFFFVGFFGFALGSLLLFSCELIGAIFSKRVQGRSLVKQEMCTNWHTVSMLASVAEPFCFVELLTKQVLRDGTRFDKTAFFMLPEISEIIILRA